MENERVAKGTCKIWISLSRDQIGREIKKQKDKEQQQQ